MRHISALAVAVAILAVASGGEWADARVAKWPTSRAGGPPAATPISRAAAILTARRSASEYLTMAESGFGVAPKDWRVRCSRGARGRSWRCRVRQGPCSGTLIVRRVTIGGGLRGVGEVGCVAD